MSDLKGLKPYSRDFTSVFKDLTSDFQVFKPVFRNFWSDFTYYRDFRDYRSDFRTFVHRISEVVGPSDGGGTQGS